MNTQQVYEKIRAHFTHPGEELATETGRGCVYRGDYDAHSPVRCAVGVLIPDEVYEPEMEVDTARDGGVRKVLEQQGIDIKFAHKCQLAHDNSTSVEHFIERLDDLAREELLDVVR